jgi:hypothetical protein
MSGPIKPVQPRLSPGRIVWYAMTQQDVASAGEEKGDVPGDTIFRPAIVVAVFDDQDRAILKVFATYGELTRDIPLTPDDDGKPGSWRWPPLVR